jgi:DNA modification methylase
MKDIETIPIIKTVAECNAAHQRFLSGCQDAIAIGDFLKKQKAKLAHGQWVPSVQDNLAFDVRSAQRYMKLFENRKFLGSKNDTLLSFLSLTDAHKVVAMTGSRATKKSSTPANRGAFEEIGWDIDEQIMLLEGEALTTLRTLPSQVVQCLISSPPFFGLRQYPNGNLGQEETRTQYIENVVTIFHEAKRVLRDDGTAFINIGDSYSKGSSVPPKNMLLIPEMLGLALQNDGWYVRNRIIWDKRNSLPKYSGKDRFSDCYEIIWFLSKKPHYYFQQILEKGAVPAGQRATGTWKEECKGDPLVSTQNHAGKGYVTNGVRNKRDIWKHSCNRDSDIVGEHSAVFPKRLIKDMILSATRPGDIVLDCFSGSGTVGAACVEHKRAALLIELSPVYCQDSLQRIVKAKPLL